MRFWRACEGLPAALGRAQQDESAFVFDELLRTEAYEPEAIFVATDGSRYHDEQRVAHVGRAYLLHDGHSRLHVNRCVVDVLHLLQGQILLR